MKIYFIKELKKKFKFSKGIDILQDALLPSTLDLFWGRVSSLQIKTLIIKASNY